MAGGHSSTAARQSKVGLRNAHARQRPAWFQCVRARGLLGNKGCGLVVGKLVVARKGSERIKDIKVEAEHNGEVGAHSRAERRRSQSTDATKAGQGEGNDEGDNEVTTWSKHGNASTKRRLRGRRRNTTSKEKRHG